MKKLLICFLVITFLLTVIMPTQAEIMEDSVFYTTLVSLSSSGTVSFYAKTMSTQNYITVTNCILFHLNGNIWTFESSLPAPSMTATNTDIYGASMNYSSYLTQSGVYRILAIFCADGHYISRFSNSITVY